MLPRRAVFTYAWKKVGRHRITVRVSGTAGHSRVDVDGFAVVDAASAYPVLVGAGDIASCSSKGDSATAAFMNRQSPVRSSPPATTRTLSGTAGQFANCYQPTWGRFKSRDSSRGRQP